MKYPLPIHIALAILTLSCLPIHVLAGPAAPPKEKTVVVKDKDGNFVETRTTRFTDEDKDGKYDKTVTESKDQAGRTRTRITDTDDNDDGKAERSVVEVYKDPTKANPSTKITRTRSETDSGWKKMEQEEDDDQDGNPEKKKTATSAGGDGQYDALEIETDANDNGIVEKKEKLLAPIREKRFDTRITETFDDVTGDPNNDRKVEERDFGNTPDQQDKPDMLRSDQARASSRTEGLGSSDTFDSNRVQFSGAILDPLGTVADPLSDIAAGARFTTPLFTRTDADIFSNLANEPFLLLSGDDVLLSGVLPSIYFDRAQRDLLHLDPAANTGVFGLFDLSTLRLAGVSASSPFYDPALPALQSAFILELDRLLSDPVFGPNLMFRFDAYEELSDGNGGVVPGTQAYGVTQLAVIPIPGSLFLMLSGVVSLLGYRFVARETGSLSRPLQPPHRTQ